MKLLDKIKQFFKGTQENEKEKFVQEQENRNTDRRKTFYRKDGSAISIEPRLDRVGNPVYRQIFNHDTGKSKCIPSYIISSDEISELTGTGMMEILMEVDSDLFNNPIYSQYIVNILLSSKRMSKIITECEGYAGGIQVKDNGELQKYIETGIINGLSAMKQEHLTNSLAEYERRDEAYRRKVIADNANRKVHEKTPHTENLLGREFNDGR